MLQIRCRQHRQGVGHRDAIVAAEGRALGENILPVVPQAQAVFGKVNVTFGILFTDHIQMALEDHRGMVLIAGGAVLINDHVVVFVLHAAQAVLLGKPDAVVGNALGIPGTVGNGAELLKIMQRLGGLQAFQYRHT